MNETLGNGASHANFRALMKRTAFCLFAAALALGFNACEGHKAEELPEHYQHKMHKDDHATDHGKGDHSKSDQAKPAAGEKKPH
jgi:hypothetical protein